TVPAVCTDHPCSKLSPVCAPTTRVLNCPRCVHRPPVFRTAQLCAPTTRVQKLSLLCAQTTWVLNLPVESP
ncbi:unnamed protein product, partial [Staurois parvus]